MSFWKVVLGDPSKKQVKKLQSNIDRINSLEKKIEKLSDEDLRGKAEEFRKIIRSRLSLSSDEPVDELEEVFVEDKNYHVITDKKKQLEKRILDEVLVEAFAVVREASRRVLGMRHFDVQLIGGVILHNGKIAEMKTGEGKTLVSTLSIYLNALSGLGVHVVTVNDYLAKRDAQWMGKIFDFLGLSVGVIVHDNAFLVDYSKKTEKAKTDNLNVSEAGGEQQVEVEEEHLVGVDRKQAYDADITYGTNNEFGFDYLRDNMASDLLRKVQRGLHYAVVDEIDSILIDEARTPLIISAPAEESGDSYRKFSILVNGLVENEDYNLDEKMRTATLTDDGIRKMENMLGVDNIYDKGVEIVHHLEQALRANVLYKKDRDYVVKDGEIIIVDEFTGRMMQGRRYSEGLHQAIEAKEGVEVKRESMTMATITFQNYFRLYDKLSGMTGTAMTESEEFFSIYKLDVVEIPTNKSLVREDANDKIFKTEEGKYQALVEEIKQRSERGQPVLVGTISIERNEYLSHLLITNGVRHEVLNAKQHEREASIIAQAGSRGSVTIATNMAGRGVDIILGGHPYDKDKAEEVKSIGGLCVFGTERHESRRIDNQLRGRAGRQGDPGFSQFFISMEDDLMRIFGADRIKRMMDTLRIPDDQPIENKIVSKAIETAQKKVEGHNFDTRKHVLEYDDVMNKQRASIYAKRNRVLESLGAESEGEIGLVEKAREIILGEINIIVATHTAGDLDQWNIREIIENIATIIPKETVSISEDDLSSCRHPGEIEGRVKEIVSAEFDKRVAELGEEHVNNIIRLLYLRVIDMFWVQHLTEMDHLRSGIGLVGYGQKDPLVEYKHRSHGMFQKLLGLIDSNFARTFFKVRIEAQPQNIETRNKGVEKHGDDDASEKKVIKSSKDRVGRNDPCPCGSGKKYKKCHGGE